MALDLLGPEPRGERDRAWDGAEDDRPGREDRGDEEHADGDRGDERPQAGLGNRFAEVRSCSDDGREQELLLVDAEAGHDWQLAGNVPQRRAAFDDRNVREVVDRRWRARGPFQRRRTPRVWG